MLDCCSDPPRQKYDLEPWPEAPVENPNEYEPGGYHPVLLDDRLGPDGRYRVVHKLGFGGFGTVWLCQESRNRRKIWRVVKILAAKASKEDCADLKMIELFKAVDYQTMRKNGVSVPLDSFWIDGPNGRHLALVMEFLGPDLTRLFNAYGHCSGLMRDICFQLLEAMQFIHSLGICHGDFRPQNILFRLKDWVQQCSEKELMEILGEPKRAEVVMYDDDDNMVSAKDEPGKPEYLVGCADISYGSGLISKELAVIDFGVAYLSSGHPAQSTSGVPGPYASPEDICRLQHMIGIKSDIWSCAAAMFKIRMGFTPFASNNHGPSAIPSMELSMGPVPPPFRAICQEWERQPVETEEELQGKPDSELSWVTTTAERHAEARKNYFEMRGAEDFLKFRMLSDHIMFFTPEQAANVAMQAERFPGLIPTWTIPDADPDWGYLHKQSLYLKYQVPREEIDAFWDLLMSVFKWKPEDRPTIETIMEHPWFEDRKKRKASVVKLIASTNNTIPAPPAPTGPAVNNINSHKDDDGNNIISRLGQVKSVIPNWLSFHFWDKSNNRTRGPAFLWRYLWRPFFKAYSKIDGWPASIFWFLMIIPAAWLIDRRIARGSAGVGSGGFLFPSSMRGAR